MAAAALVSTADEDVRLSEQLALDQLLERMDLLRVFDPHTGVDLHRRFVDGIGAHRGHGRREALAALTAFRGDEDQGLLILYVAAGIAKADQNLSEPEERALHEICDALGLPAQESLARIWDAGTVPPPAD